MIRWLVYEQAEVVPMIGGLRFRLLTHRLSLSDADAMRRRDAASEILGQLDRHVTDRAFLIGDIYTIADIALYGYLHVAAEARLGLEPFPHLRGWLAHVADTPSFIADLAPYGANAEPGAGRSIYD